MARRHAPHLRVVDSDTASESSTPAFETRGRPAERRPFNWGTLTPKVRVEIRDRNGNSVNQQLWYLDAPASPYVLAVRGLDERSALAALGLEAAFGNVRLTFEYGTAGSAEDLFQGQSVRLQLRADF